MVLGGKLDAIEEARFQRDVVFRDGNVSGDGDMGLYRAAKGQLVLEPVAPVRKAPHVTSADVEVNATDRIEIDLTTRDVYALGDVKTVMKQNAGSRGTSSALFDGSEPTLGFGREFWYTERSGQVRYVGPANARASIRQGERQVTARTIEGDKDGGHLTANGAVESVLILESQQKGRGSTSPTRYRVTAEALEYREEARTATYTGTPTAPVVLTATDGTTTSRRLVLTLARESKTLDRLDATTDVHLKLNSGREALANTLTYEAATDRYVLRGDVRLRVQEEKPVSCSRWEASEAHFTAGTQAPSFPGETGFVHRSADSGPCVGALTR
jgi:lipopolysaccharide export system protein LptA